MATHRIPIFSFATLPDKSGNVFFQPADVDAGFSNLLSGVFVFADTGTEDGLHGRFRVPQNYVATAVAKFEVEWTAANDVIAGNNVWNIDYRTIAGNDTDDMDQTIAEEGLTVTDAAPSAAGERLLVTVGDLTQGNLSPGETVNYILARDGAVGGPTDTMVAAAFVFDLWFEYEDA